MKLTITKTDGSVSTHQITHSMMVNFERNFGGGFSEVIQAERLEHGFYLAYLCMKKAGFDKPFDDDFMDSIDLIEYAADDPNG